MVLQYPEIQPNVLTSSSDCTRKHLGFWGEESCESFSFRNKRVEMRFWDGSLRDDASKDLTACA